MRLTGKLLTCGVAGALLGGAVVAPTALATDFRPGSAPPADARPGECYGRVTAAAPADRRVERVLVRPARTEQRWAPAVSRWRETRVLVKPAWTETIREPAVYRTVYDTVLEPGPRRFVQTAPSYRKVTERVLVSPARVVWKRGRGAVGYGGEPGATRLEPTGEVWCRVKVPARYATKVRWVQTSPGCRCEVEGPPVHRRVARRVVVREARETVRQHPAVYRTQRECVIVRPGHAYTVTVPAVHRTVTHVRRHEQGGWARVLCPDGLQPWAVARIQAALNARGYAAGPEDGVATPQTDAALRRFQRDNGMAQGQVTHESARALGVIR